jgi:hypothetical protein
MSGDPINFNYWINILSDKSRQYNKSLINRENILKDTNALRLLLLRIITNDSRCSDCGNENLIKVYDYYSNLNWNISESSIDDIKTSKGVEYPILKQILDLFMKQTQLEDAVKSKLDDLVAKANSGIKPTIRTADQLVDCLKNDSKSLTEAEGNKLLSQLLAISEYNHTMVDGKIVYAFDETRRNVANKFPDINEEELVKEVAKVAVAAHKTSGRYPRVNQLITVLQFLEGKNTLIQVGTGQGKSLIVGMTAILQTKLKRPIIPGDDRPMAVHIMTVTEDLVKDAIDSNAKLFEECGVYARSILGAGGTKSNINADDDIIYDTPNVFLGQILREASGEKDPKQLLILDRVRRTVIVDESDTKLVDSCATSIRLTDEDKNAERIKHFFKNVIIPEAKRYCETINKDNLTDYNFFKRYNIPIHFHTSILIKQIEDKNLVNTNIAARWSAFKKKWVENAISVFSPDTIYIEGQKYLVRDALLKELNLLKEKGLKQDIFDTLVINLGNNYIGAAPFLIPGLAERDKEILTDWYVNIKDEDFSKEVESIYFRLINGFENIIESCIYGNAMKIINAIIKIGQIKYLETSTGQILETTIFEGGIHEFLEFKHFGVIMKDSSLTYRSYSLSRYLRESELVFGLSGTIGKEDRVYSFQAKVWKVNRPPVIVPNFALSQLKMKEGSINENTQEKWFNTIYNKVNILKKYQPILIITQDPDQARYVQVSLRKKNVLSSLYIRSTDIHILSKLLIPGEIIITTNLGGRGSDYKYDPVTAPQGLHVIIGFNSTEPRIIDQAKGRAGRAGNPGSWQIISYGLPLIQNPNIDANCNKIKEKICYDMIFEVYLFFKKYFPITITISSSGKIIKEKTKLDDFIDWIADDEKKNDIVNKILGIQSYDSEIKDLVFSEWYPTDNTSFKDCIFWDKPSDHDEKVAAIKAKYKKMPQDIELITRYLLTETNNVFNHSLISYAFVIELTELLCPHFEEIIRLDSCAYTAKKAAI